MPHRARLTHLDARNRPAMVDIGDKAVTAREAVAEARVTLPAEVARALAASGHRTRKGPVFDTAIIAAVQAVKRTHELIPFCHPLPIEHCDIDIETPRRGHGQRGVAGAPTPNKGMGPCATDEERCESKRVFDKLSRSFTLNTQ